MWLRVYIPLMFCVSLAVTQTVVNIPGLGSLQGSTSQSYFTNRTIYQFKGIPYAERPVRFMPPTKKTAWEGVLNATEDGRICPQTQILNENTTDDIEDCLFLDIYTPQLSNDSKLPILFQIHGGGWVMGSNSMNTPGFLLEHDVILVSIQYRLGPLGFLYLGIDEVPGNAGMFDQLMALQWVYDNILYFGGDPEMITVTGGSAGAASSSLLYVSPLSQGLIKHVMPFSGSALSLIAVGLDPVLYSMRIAKYAGCEAGDQLVSCLQTVDAKVLVQAYSDYEEEEKTQGRSAMGGTNPVVDGKFLPAMPLDILRNSSFKPLPYMTTTAKHEGIDLESAVYEMYLQGNNLTDDAMTLKYGIPDVLLSFAETEDTSCTIATAIKDEYFKPEEFGNYTAMRAGITDFLGSAYFKGPALKIARLNYLRGGPTYLATLYYATGNSPIVNHGSEMPLLFPSARTQYTEEDLEMVRNLTTIAATFAATGTPSGVSWEPYTLEEGKYLIINGSMPTSTYFEKEFTVAEREGLYK